MSKNKSYFKYFIFPILLLILSLSFYSGYLFSESHKKEYIELSEEIINGQVYVAFRFENTTHFLINYTDHKLFFGLDFSNELFDSLVDFHITNTNESIFAYFLFADITKQEKINVNFINFNYAKTTVKGSISLLSSTYHDECSYYYESSLYFTEGFGFENKILSLPSDFALRQGFPETWPYAMLTLSGIIKGV